MEFETVCSFSAAERLDKPKKKVDLIVDRSVAKNIEKNTVGLLGLFDTLSIIC